MINAQILKNDYPLLKEKSKHVTKFDNDLIELCETMTGAMVINALPSISAVQVGKLERVIAFVAANKDVAHKIVVMVNPKIIERSDRNGFNDTYEFEGIYGDRELFAKSIFVKYKQTDGKVKRAFLKDVNAVLCQRQIQYLDGLK